ncbi:glutamate ABC transporter substrate-binding protein [Pseudonocardia eucalypti]|uniref:Glutamate ABC transporter substrate-binding protein n=1 Tax=Pseudonocardia eucalypti TaxID=648755 RepID=A0ABP9Q0P4_9PSEU|nr:polar amino acid transport system substrate-binding protein [Pseudonocardia eucalypti]
MNRVELRRPARYLAVAGALALLSLLIPTGGSEPAAPAAAQSAPAQPAPPSPACTEIRDSLRPAGPTPAPGAMPAGSTMAAIVARGRLIAGVDQGKYLIGYRNPTTGDLAGSDIDLARRIAGALFGDPNKVQFVVLNIADRSAAIQRGQVDMVVNSFAVTCQRQRDVLFSADYLDVTQRILVPRASPVREVEDLAGQRICTSKGSTTEVVLRALPAKPDVLALPGLPDCMIELHRGRVAAVSSDDVLLAGLAAQDPQTAVVGRALDHTRYAVGVNLNAADLARFVNAVLDRGRNDGSLAANHRQWFAGVLNPVPALPPARYSD